jgi:outer membrane protein assembly factor BamE
MVQYTRPSPLRKFPIPGGAIRAFAVASLGLMLSLGASGCVYRMTVQQGNFLDPKQVSQLQAGMTRSQVRFLLGTPMLPDAFDRDRWDYLYYEKIGRLKKPDQRRLTVWFTEDKVQRYENVGTPLADAGAPAPVEPPQVPAVPPAVTPPAQAPSGASPTPST